MTSFEYAKKTVVDIVTKQQGCKLTDLIGLLPDEILSQAHEIPIHDLIEDLLESGHLIEVCYELPSMSHRLKSFLLPSNTDVTVRSTASNCQVCGHAIDRAGQDNSG